ncbi:PTS sugar transporter subunit IIA [Virgibacillus halodenitrificans]|uniref:PTS sugar transporter subunit IIA n=1 Tax=Virgibacillus halodenitrificans TaxID=1482 RepID=UPI001F3B08CF|nr:PTS sugar transporter subunit IIA [Virgibacillus halodenitrificans]
MIGIVLTGHGSFPIGMLESVKLIAGDIKQISVVPFEEDQEVLQKDLRAAIEEVNTGDGVVCFADLAGGTPFNVSSRLAAEQESVRVIGGTNLPMLLSSLFQRELDLDAFVQLAIVEGKENIKPFGDKKKETVEAEDGI